MSKFNAISSEDLEFCTLAEMVSAEDEEKLTDEELRITAAVRQPATSDLPGLVEAHYPPGTVVQPHAHEDAEIVFVLAGELVMGRSSYGPGTSLLIPGRTLYSFRVGNEELRLLVFKAREDTSLISKSEFMEMRSVE